MKLTSLKSRVAAIAVLAGTVFAGGALIAPGAHAATIGSWNFQHFYRVNGGPVRDPWQVAWDGCQVRFPGTHSVRQVGKKYQGLVDIKGQTYEVWMLTYTCSSDK